ncbi:MAG: ADP-ribosylglycohydrolase family protein [Lachnospiraceae bacterium]|nr:ADP-ribosylglycohydrolase family protein [Lachnospiraceae bacterium]
MYGAILGDMIGAPYEFDQGNKSKDFEMFNEDVMYTDDTVMTIAVADALMGLSDNADEDTVKAAVVKSMRIWGNRYPDAGYGVRFFNWLFDDKEPKPYGSWGNGSAMRVSSVGWLFDTLDETRRYARLTAEVTHNHPEGIKGAEAAASAIFLARIGISKEEIKEYIVNEFDYDLSHTCDEIRPGYHHIESCQYTVPEAITAFLEGNDFEDVIRTAVSLGGDCDTLTCIAGAIGEAFYGVPEEMRIECRKRLPEDMLRVLYRFEKLMLERYVVPDADLTEELLEDGSFLRKAIQIGNRNPSKLNMLKIFRILSESWVWVPCTAIFSDADNDAVEKVVMEAVENNDLDSLAGHTFTNRDEVRMVSDILQSGDDYFFPVFTSDEDMGEYGEQFSKVQRHFLDAANLARNNEKRVKGIVINAFTENYIIPIEMLDVIAGKDSGIEEEGESNG